MLVESTSSALPKNGRPRGPGSSWICRSDSTALMAGGIMAPPTEEDCMKRQLSLIALGGALLWAGHVLAQQQEGPQVRRIVTKLDDSGKAVVMLDERLPMSGVRPPNYVANIWVTEKSLPDFSSTADRGKTKTGLTPPKGGTVFRIVEFMPEPESIARLDVNTMQRVVGAADT